MSGFWGKHIERADYLAAEASGSRELLAFYAQLLRAQFAIYESFRNWLPSGDLETDLAVVQSSMPGLLECVARHGPQSLAAEAQGLAPAVMASELLDYWRSPLDTKFFAKSVLQPYTHWLAETRITPVGRELAGGERTCPFCGGKPQVSFLQAKESGAERSRLVSG